MYWKQSSRRLLCHGKKNTCWKVPIKILTQFVIITASGIMLPLEQTKQLQWQIWHLMSKRVKKNGNSWRGQSRNSWILTYRIRPADSLALPLSYRVCQIRYVLETICKIVAATTCARREIKITAILVMVIQNKLSRR